MTLEEIYYISQIVAVVAILGSLLAIYFQMRQNHAFVRANEQREFLDQVREWWALSAESEEKFQTICSGLQDFHGLDRFQQAQFHAWAADMQAIFTGAFFQHRSTLISPSSHEGMARAFLSILNTPGGHAWWEMSSKTANKDVVTYLNARLAAEAATLPVWTDLVPHFRLPPARTEATKPKDLA